MGYNEHFTDKVAVVTGAGSGMGRAAAIAFAGVGAKVVAADINSESVAETVTEIRDKGGDAVSVHADVSRSDDVQALIAHCCERYGRLDCAVNNAAVEIGRAPLADSEESDFDRLVAVNLKGVFLCLKYEIRQMVAQGGGSIVNIASVNSFRPQPGQSMYTATKHGVIGLTRSAAIEYAEANVRVNAICPGAIDTPMLADALSRSELDPIEVAQRLSVFGRFGRPGEVANAVLWLCSDLSSFTTGHALAVDGGYLAR